MRSEFSLKNKYLLLGNYSITAHFLANYNHNMYGNYIAVYLIQIYKDSRRIFCFVIIYIVAPMGLVNITLDYDSPISNTRTRS